MVQEYKEKALVKMDQRNASKSQRAQRIERGMRPRQTIHARSIERRAKRAFTGKPL